MLARLFWAGVLKQVLCRGAEGTGVRGIGCYFDDAAHEMLGLGRDEFRDRCTLHRRRPIRRPAADRPAGLPPTRVRGHGLKQSYCRSEQPPTNVLRHLPQPLVAESLAVVVRDVGAAGVAHDGPHCQEVARLVADRLEGVPQSVEIPVPVDVEGVEQLSHFVGQGAVRLLGPAASPACRSRTPGRRRSGSSSAPAGRPAIPAAAATVSGQSGHRRRMPVFGRGVIDPTALQVQGRQWNRGESVLPKPAFTANRIMADNWRWPLVPTAIGQASADFLRLEHLRPLCRWTRSVLADGTLNAPPNATGR